MRPRDFLPHAGWMTLAFTGLGVGAAVALVSPAPEPASSARTLLAAGPHCRVAATMPAQGQMAEVIKTYESGDPPLWDDLGTLSYPISTKNAQAQAYFDQGIRQAANFNHAEARRAFRKAQSLDPNCATCFAAEAGMDTQPWDYWEPGGKLPKGRSADVQKRLEAVLAKNPDHPWAMHLYIHFVEASDRPERGEPYADRLAALMPGAGHIVHMPSHIYFRVGRYADSLTSNQAASKVDEDYIAQTGAMGVYPIGYYSHNVHFVLVSAALLGDRPTVLAQAEKLDKWLTNDVAAQIPFVQPVKAAPYFAWAQYGDPDMVLNLPDPPGAPPYVKAMWHYARGAALAAKKDPAAARKEVEAIQAIVKNTDWSVLTQWGIPAEPVLNVAAEVVLARAAQAEGKQEVAIASLKKAAETQDTIPYMEPPFWYYPVRQSLGAALIMTGKPEEAQKEFAAALERERNSAWVLYGIKEAAKAKGDAAAEQKAAEDLAKIWKGDPAMLTLGRL